MNERLNQQLVTQQQAYNDHQKRSNESLKRGHYNRKYVIQLIKAMLKQIEEQKLNPRDLSITLTYSLNQLLTQIEMEENQTCGMSHDALKEWS